MANSASERVNALLELLHTFTARRVSLEVFLDRLNELNRAGLLRELPKEAEEPISEFVIWYADMYDSKLSPRRGFWGGLRDRWDAWRGIHRVSREHIEEAAIRLERSLSGLALHI